VPLAILLGVGLLASLWRFGGFVSCAAGIVLALAVTHRVNEWARHHSARWPRGIDNIPDKWSSDQVPQGAWEKNASQAAFSLSHWTIGLAIAIVLVYLLTLYRRMRARERVALIEAAAAAEPAATA
jgi:Ca2+/H+ antiporter